MLPFERVEPVFKAAGTSRSGAHRPGDSVATGLRRSQKSPPRHGSHNIGRGVLLPPTASAAAPSSSPPRSERSPQRAMSPLRQTVRIASQQVADQNTSASTVVAKFAKDRRGGAANAPSSGFGSSAEATADERSGWVVDARIWGPDAAREVIHPALHESLWINPVDPAATSKTDDETDGNASPFTVFDSLEEVASSSVGEDDICVRDYLHHCSDVKAIAQEREMSFPGLVPRTRRVVVRPAVLQAAQQTAERVVFAHVADVRKSRCTPSAVRCVIPDDDILSLHVHFSPAATEGSQRPPLWVDTTGVLFVDVGRLTTNKALITFSVYAEDVADIRPGPSGMQTARSAPVVVEVQIGNAAPQQESDDGIPPGAAKKKLHDAIQQASLLEQHTSPTLPATRDTPRTLPAMPLHAFRLPTETTTAMDLVTSTLLTHAPVMFLRSSSDLCERQMLRRGVVIRNDEDDTFADRLGRQWSQNGTRSKLKSSEVSIRSIEELQRALPAALEQFSAEMSRVDDDGGSPPPSAMIILDQLVPLLFAANTPHESGNGTFLVQDMVDVRAELQSRRVFGFGIGTLKEVADELSLVDLIGGDARGSSQLTTTAPSNVSPLRERPQSQLSILSSIIRHGNQAFCNTMLRYLVEAAHIHKHLGAFATSLSWYKSALCFAVMQFRASSSSSDDLTPDGGSRSRSGGPTLSFDDDQLGITLPLLRVIGDMYAALGRFKDAAVAFESGRSIAECKARLMRIEDDSTISSRRRMLELQAAALDASVAAAGALCSSMASTAALTAFHRCSKFLEGAKQECFLNSSASGTADSEAAASLRRCVAQSIVDSMLMLAYCCMARDQVQQSVKFVDEAEGILNAAIFTEVKPVDVSDKVLQANIFMMRSWIAAVSAVRGYQSDVVDDVIESGDAPGTDGPKKQLDSTKLDTATIQQQRVQSHLEQAQQACREARQLYLSASLPEDVCTQLFCAEGLGIACREFSTFACTSVTVGTASDSTLSGPSLALRSVSTTEQFGSTRKAAPAVANESIVSVDFPIPSPAGTALQPPIEGDAKDAVEAPVDPIVPSLRWLSRWCEAALVPWHPLACSVSIGAMLETATEWRRVTPFTVDQSYRASEEAIQGALRKQAFRILEDFMEISRVSPVHYLRAVWPEAITTALLLVHDAESATRCIIWMGDAMASMHAQHHNAHSTTTTAASASSTALSSCWHMVVREVETFCRHMPYLAAQCFTTMKYFADRAAANGDNRKAQAIHELLCSEPATRTQTTVLRLMQAHGVLGSSSSHAHKPTVPQRFKGELACFFLDLAELDYSRGNWMGCLESCGRALRLADERNLLYLLGDLFRPSFQLSPPELEDRHRLSRDRRVSSTSGLVLALTLYATARVHEAAGSLTQALQVFTQAFAALELLHLVKQPLAMDALIGCARTSMQLGQLGDALMYADKAHALFEMYHAHYGAYRTQRQLVELRNHLLPVQRVIHEMTEERHYRLSMHEEWYTSPHLNGFPLYI